MTDTDSDNGPTNVMARSLPKPVVYGFVAILILGIVVPLGYKWYQANQQNTPTQNTLAGGQQASGLSVSDQLTQWGEQSSPAELEAELKRHPELARFVDGDGMTLLHYSAAAMRDDLIAVALRHAAQPDVFTSEGQTPLHIVLFMHDYAELLAGHMDYTPGDYKATMRALLEGGADPNAFLAGSPEGSPMTWAIDNGMDEAAAILAEYGGDASSNPPDFPTMHIAQGDELFPTWNALAEAGFYELSMTEVSALIDRERIGQTTLMGKAFQTVEGGGIVILLGNDGKVGPLIYWPDAPLLQSSDALQYLESIDLRLP